MVREHMEAQLKRSSAALPKGLKDREQRLTKMMLFIFGCFLVTYLPGAIVKLVRVQEITNVPGARISCFPLVDETRVDY